MRFKRCRCSAVLDTKLKQQSPCLPRWLHTSLWNKACSPPQTGTSPAHGPPDICGFLSFLPSPFCLCGLGTKKNKHPLFLLLLDFPDNKGLLKQIEKQLTIQSFSNSAFLLENWRTEQIGLAGKAGGSPVGALSPD